MRYHDITHVDMKNGDGLRTVLWVSGCEHACPGCHNPTTWCVNSGIEFDSVALQELLDSLKHDYVSGLTLSGGDPLHPANREAIAELVKIVRQHYPDKTIWAYTGYSWEEICDLEAVRHFDVLIDGRFVQELHRPNLKWVGSDNQRIIDVPATLADGKIVLHTINPPASK